MTVLGCVAVFVIYFLIDIFWAVYTNAVTSRSAGTAATAGALTYAASAAGVLSYVQNRWYIVPMFLGAWAGTYLTVRVMKKNENNHC